MGKASPLPSHSPSSPPPPPPPPHHRLIEMEKLSVHQKSTKQAAKSKKKPIKVVYISNPMRLTSTAADFRATVQKLTGRDSNVAELDASGSPATDSEVGRNSPAAATGPDLGAGHGVDGYSSMGGETFEMFDECFAPQSVDNFSAMYNVCGMWK